MSAAIAAAFLLYFGFAVIVEPVGTGLFERSGLVFYHTLRIGGVAMAIVAVVSMIGHPVALLLDAIAAALIGVLLILTGGGMMAGGGGGMQTVINVLCGLMFLSSARGLWADFATWKAGARSAAAEPYAPPRARMSAPVVPPAAPAPTAASPLPNTASAPSPSEPTSLAGKLREQRRAPDSVAPPGPTEPTATELSYNDAPVTGPGSLAGADWSDQPRNRDVTGPAPASQGGTGQDDGGFLASFADEGPPPTP